MPTSLPPARLPPSPLSPFSRYPLKALYLLYLIPSVLVLHPWWIVKRLFHIKDHFPRRWTLSEVLNVQRVRLVFRALGACDIGPLTLDWRVLGKGNAEQRAVWIPAAPEEYVKGVFRSEWAKPVNIPGYVSGKGRAGKDGERMKVEEGEGVLLYFHGGGFMFGSAHSCDVTYNNVRQLLRLTPSLHHALSVDYRKVTVSPFPGALLDSLAAYLYLINDVGVAPDRIVLAGDSAGGSLALTLMRYIRDELKKPEWMPGTAVLLSPLANMEYDLGPKQRLVKRRNGKSDLLDMAIIQPYMASRLLSLSPVSLIDSPWLSPAASTVPATDELFKDFPPTFVTAGGAEVLCDGIEELVRRLEKSGVEHVFHLEPDAPHDFQMFPWYDPPAGAALYAKLAEWVEGQLSRVESEEVEEKGEY